MVYIFIWYNAIKKRRAFWVFYLLPLILDDE
jgi:hypothetical protein